MENETYGMQSNVSNKVFQKTELAPCKFLRVNLNWIGHTPPEVELEREEEKFTELLFKEIQHR